LNAGWKKKKYIEMFGSFIEPFIWLALLLKMSQKTKLCKQANASSWACSQLHSFIDFCLQMTSTVS